MFTVSGRCRRPRVSFVGVRDACFLAAPGHCRERALWPVSRHGPGTVQARRGRESSVVGFLFLFLFFTTTELIILFLTLT